MAEQHTLTTEEWAVIADVQARKWCRDIAETLAEHLKTSTDPDAATWSEALTWFAKRIKGGHLSIYVQQDFDKRFGPVDWSAFSEQPPAQPADGEQTPTPATEEGL